MEKDFARAIVLTLVGSGTPVSVRRRDELWAAAEPDEEFNEQVRSYAAARDARERDVRESNRQFVQMLKDVGFP